MATAAAARPSATAGNSRPSVFKGASAIEGSAEAATALNVALFNEAVGLGSLLGGIIQEINRRIGTARLKTASHGAEE